MNHLVKSSVMVAASLCCFACGAASDPFVGRWTGTVATNTATCTGSAHAQAAATTTETWLAARTATGLQLATQNFCGTIAATVSGSVATITNAGSKCSGTTSDTYTIAGSFTVKGDVLTGAYTVHGANNTTQDACDIPVVVNLTRQ
jgi:hypothetical protein